MIMVVITGGRAKTREKEKRGKIGKILALLVREEKLQA